MDITDFTYYSIEELIARAHNPRTHSKAQVRQIAASIEEFGWTNPILIDDVGGIIAGHGRVAAAKLLKLDQVPTLRLADLTEAQIQAYVITDNKLAENAGWDREILATELQGLMDLDFDIELTGFEMAEIDIVLEDIQLDDSDPDDDIPDIDDEEEPVTRIGDLWTLGSHRLLCGDALDLGSYVTLLGDHDADMVFTDPPYNVPIAGHVSGLGMHKHREFEMASGEMSPAAFTNFLTTVCDNMSFCSEDGALHYICMDWRHMDELMGAGNKIYTELKALCVWNKSNGGMGSLYRSKHELVFVYKNGSGSHTNNIQLGKFGRNRTNVWEYAGANAFGGTRDEDLAMHPTVKPVALVSDAIMDCTKRDAWVLDPFSGSGTTLIAAEKTCRQAAGLEIDPRYVDVAVKRWQQLTGSEAVHQASGQTFNELRLARQGSRNLDQQTVQVY